MTKKQLLVAIAIVFIVFIPVVVFAQEASPVNSPEAVTVPISTVAVVSAPERSVVVRSGLTRTKVAKATLSFWEKLAQCETSNNWKNTGMFAGGLGIYTAGKFGDRDMGTWERWGGEEFAPSPDKATKAEQIIVANRVSVEGWKATVYRDPAKAKRQGIPAVYVWDKKPVGFGGWGCYKSKSTGLYRMDKPRLYYYDDPFMVPHARFYANEQSALVEDLQTFLRIKVDGLYGEKTRKAHIAWLNKKKFSISGVPQTKQPIPEVLTTSISKASVGHSVAHSCPQWDAKLKHYGLPVKEFSRIMYRESRCQEKVIGWNYHKGTSYKDCKMSPASTYKKCKAVRSYDSGLLQVNSSWASVTKKVCHQRRVNMSALLNANCNLAVAKYLYDNGGMHHWKATSGR